MNFRSDRNNGVPLSERLSNGLHAVLALVFALAVMAITVHVGAGLS